jgi:hypothetical protein
MHTTSREKMCNLHVNTQAVNACSENRRPGGEPVFRVPAHYELNVTEDASMLENPVARRLRVALLFGSVLLFGGPSAWAQAQSRPFSDVGERLQLGKRATVVTTTGQEIEGRLSELSATSLALLVDGKLQTIEAADVKRVRQRQSDSLKNGVLIGAASGAAYALMWFVRDPNECGGSLCGQEFVYSAGLGALIGLAIDASIKRTVTLEVAAAPRSSTKAHTRAGTVAGSRMSFSIAMKF